MRTALQVLYRLGSLLLLIILTIACQPSNTSTQATEETAVTEPEDRAQIVLLTQTTDYDPEAKAEIRSNYEARTSLTVPKNLAPQNKWFMFEGPVLENDLIAYRYYADSRHRFDIYGKYVNELVMDTVSWDYHDIMDWGSDILKVGNSLGIGSPAVYYQDSLYLLSDYGEKQIEIIKDTDDHILLRTQFTDLRIGDQTYDLIQDWEMRAGAPWSAIRLRTNRPLAEGMYFATGIVKHLPDIQTGRKGDYFYAWNWGVQSFHEQELGMAITAPLHQKPELITDALSHAYVFRQSSQEVNYRFLAAWAGDVNQIKTATDFAALVERVAQ